ncbi:hypothetical protein ACH40F_51990 [Streptomyces sp. NPDC020794]|uniref:hypothetical protein n=1 Tax=unclassified Streptomyces TaxID=2593676 RepID=UPI0036E6A602
MPGALPYRPSGPTCSQPPITPLTWPDDLSAPAIPYDCVPHHTLTLIVAELAPDRSARKAAWRMVRREEGLDDDV